LFPFWYLGGIYKFEFHPFLFKKDLMKYLIVLKKFRFYHNWLIKLKKYLVKDKLKLYKTIDLNIYEDQKGNFHSLQGWDKE